MRLDEMTAPDEHPDTVALRECRAEMKTRGALWRHACETAESARAERDTARGAHAKLLNDTQLTEAELDTALARIAELEAEVAGLKDQLQEAEWSAMGEDL